ncbi:MULTISPECIES: DUF6328 family protein [Anaeromyxobacter]|uniref:DUF6328 family protein n=1 Tax=Anaeromyxobacter TaxID=161492 RepID=UPI001F5A8088|nr:MULTISPECIES: DUF6328 family protein [unclassified Anaeromyxobacter]
MAELSSKVQNALDEARILVLGLQVLIGFDLRAFFEPGFEELPGWARASKLATLVTLLLALALVVLPSPWHRLVEAGEDTEGIHRLTMRAVSLALLPFALGLSGDVAIGLQPVAGALGAVLAGAAVALVAVGTWYAATGVARRRRPPREEGTEVSDSSVEKKIRHVLTEARMVLPGAQALLGFQLAVMMTRAFRELPREAQWAHVGAVGFGVLTIVLLVAPAAWHRIVERGEETEAFHRVATRFVVAAILPLAVALAVDLGVVTVRLVPGSQGLPVAVAGATFALLAGTWFALPLAARALRRGRPRAAPQVSDR